MIGAFVHALGVASAALACAGVLYALAAAIVVRRFAGAPASAATALPGVTLLKPLHGAEPGLEDNLTSFCDQDYEGPVQALFGVQDAADDAVTIVERVVATQPRRDIRLCVNRRMPGANPKVATLVGLQQYIRHPIVVIADSDIAVERDYLATVVAALDPPGVGCVTCLYRGEARAGLWSRLSAMAIDYHFLPSVLVGLALGVARPCFGSTIALRRDTLASIGGFEAFLGALADDYAIGEAVRGAGLRVAIPRMVVVHGCADRTAGEWLRHELRWARTLRAVSPWGYAGLAITHALPFALLAAVSMSSIAMGAALIAAAVASRLVLQVQVDHTLGVSRNRWWLGPARDLLAFAVYVASFFTGAVEWRGHRYTVRADGTLASGGDPRT